jgi:UDP-N-acetylglucosamine 2-epimerase (non-hydrolysing)
LKTYLLIVGTRPEAIKIAPLYLELKRQRKVKVILGLTGQHQEIVYQVLSFFSIKPDFDLKLMSFNQNQVVLISEILKGLNEKVININPDVIIAQGDTNSVMAASLVSFYNKIRFVHLEAGLRSFNFNEPFPEEFNRVLAGKIAWIHLAPTTLASKNLINEGIQRKFIYTVGNTVIDALMHGVKIIKKRNVRIILEKKFNFLNSNKKTILLTCHRRENFGDPVKKILDSIKESALNFSEIINFCIPVHPNPNVKKIFHEYLSDLPNVFLFDPFSYEELIFVMEKSYLIITDSGGIQEEAPSLKKPVFVLRNVSERKEGIIAGNSLLIGNSEKKFQNSLKKILFDEKYYHSFIKNSNPYGNGKSSQKIASILSKIV